jgi:hypothetical protein
MDRVGFAMEDLLIAVAVGLPLPSGTFALLGRDPASLVYFRSIRVKPLE